MLAHTKSLPSCLIPCHPMNCSLLGSPVHVILQARILEWVAMPSSKGPSPPRDRTHMSYVKNPKGGHWGSSDTQPQLTYLSLWPPLPPPDSHGDYLSRGYTATFGLQERRSSFQTSSHSQLSTQTWLTLLIDLEKKVNGVEKVWFWPFRDAFKRVTGRSRRQLLEHRGQRKPKALSFLCNSSILAARPGCWLSS